ncbi:MAG: C-GCAxxG-C-C family protein [Candidatus Krumholzibacteriota bacterium]
MSERVEQAVTMFVDGYSCAQSLLAVYGPDLGVEREAALRLAAPLGGGLARTDGPCGAATGALLVLGLKHGHTLPDDEAGSERIRNLSQEFLRRYDEIKGSTMCTDILGHNLSLPGIAEKVKEGQLAQDVCPEAVRTAAQLLEEFLDLGL